MFVMRKVRRMLCLCIPFTGCGGEKKAEAPKSDAKPAPVTKKAEAAPAPANGKVLVAYFSWGGTTRKVAQAIQQKTGGDLFEIKTEKPYPTDYHATIDIGKKEKEDNVRPKLAGPLPDMKQYDVILLGYPIWWYIEPMAVKTFVEAQDLSIGSAEDPSQCQGERRYPAQLHRWPRRLAEG